MRTMLVGATGVVIAAAAMVGCGEDSGPTAEQRAAKAKWIQRVDGLCRKANAEIADRGYPIDLIDLDRLVVRGIEDARGAIREVARERVPEGVGPRPAAFVKELRELDGDLDRLSAASEDLDPHALVDAADQLAPRLASLQVRAKAAGLRDCVSHDERLFIPDAVRAPVFAEQVAVLDRKFLRRIQLIEFGEASSAGEYAHAFSRYAGVIDDAVDGIAKLDPPMWATDQTANYQDALRDLQAVSRKFADKLAADKGKPLKILDSGEYTAIQRELTKASFHESTARRKMLRAVRAGPTSPPGSGPGMPQEPDDTEVS
jgi:hypothetical protein